MRQFDSKNIIKQLVEKTSEVDFSSANIIDPIKIVKYDDFFGREKIISDLIYGSKEKDSISREINGDIINELTHSINYDGDYSNSSIWGSTNDFEEYTFNKFKKILDELNTFRPVPRKTYLNPCDLETIRRSYEKYNLRGSDYGSAWHTEIIHGMVGFETLDFLPEGIVVFEYDKDEVVRYIKATGDEKFVDEFLINDSNLFEYFDALYSIKRLYAKPDSVD